VNRVNPPVKKILLSALSVVLATAMLIPLTSCAMIEERLVKQGITRELEDIKQLRNRAVNEMIQSAGSSADFEEIGVNPEDFLKAWFSDFDYLVDDVSINGNEGDASVTLNCKTAKSFFDTLGASIAQFINEDPPADERSSKEVFAELFIEAAKNAPSEAVSLVLPLEKKDRIWAPSEGYFEGLENVLVGDVDASEGLFYASVLMILEPLKRIEEGSDAMKYFLQRFGTDEDFLSFGIDKNEYSQLGLGGFDYSVEAIAIESPERASATIVVSCKKIADAEANCENKLNDLVANGTFAAMSDEDIKKTIGSLLLAALTETAPSAMTITLPFVNRDGLWEIDPESQELGKAIFGD